MFWCEVARDAVVIHGPDAQSYLQSQLSQDLGPLDVGARTDTFVLAPTGKIEVLARVWRTADDTFVLDTDQGFGDVLDTRLRRFKIRVKAEIEPIDWRFFAVVDGAAWGVHDVAGPDAVAPDGLAEGSAEQLEVARIEAVWPAMGSEITPGETLVAEMGINERAVSFTKGCYPGQELVERMDSRGAAAPRRLCRVDVPVGTSAGDVYVIDGAEAGTVTSVSGTTALALVKRSFL